MNENEVITVSFKNNYLITDRLLKMALERLYEKPEYENVITYNSVHDDSFIYQISCDKTGEHMVTITRYGENIIETKIQGQKRFIQKFMTDLLSEISVIILSMALETMYDKSLDQDLEEFLETKIKNVLNELNDKIMKNEE